MVMSSNNLKKTTYIYPLVVYCSLAHGHNYCHTQHANNHFLPSPHFRKPIPRNMEYNKFIEITQGYRYCNTSALPWGLLRAETDTFPCISYDWISLYEIALLVFKVPRGLLNETLPPPVPTALLLEYIWGKIGPEIWRSNHEYVNPN